MLTATLGAQCMSWQTSPAATELEQRVMEWLRDLIGLPPQFTGVIQDTASTATLCSILTAREKVSRGRVNQSGLMGEPRYTVYCSTETHSSIEKAVKIAGLGKENLRKIAVDESFAMRADELARTIEADLAAGCVPLCVVAALGGPVLRRLIGSGNGDICRKHGICTMWMLPTPVRRCAAGCRWMSEGVELADTFVFNPHKWLLTNFDCSAYFVKDPAALVQTFEILPEYLKTAEGDRVNNYRDWGIQLGRRFRALKLWFVIRSYGAEGLRAKVRHDLELARWLADEIQATEGWELLAPRTVNLVCFRYHPQGVDDADELNRLNEGILERVNATGKMYMTHTKLNGAYTLRMVIAQTQVTRADVAAAWGVVKKGAQR